MVKTGAYIFGVVSCDRVLALGKIGLGGGEVVAIPDGKLSTVVQWCDPDDYKSENPEVVKGWVVAHQEVVDRIWKEFKNILPMHFGMIVTGESRKDVIGKVVSWMDQKRDHFTDVLSNLGGRAEYGVQVFCNRDDLRESVVNGDSELSKRRNELKSMSEGMAYLKRQGLEALVREMLAKRLDSERKLFLEKIEPVVEKVSVEKCKESHDDRMMILNISCLADDIQTGKLGELLEDFEKGPGISVRFTGPWPPYSFVSV